MPMNFRQISPLALLISVRLIAQDTMEHIPLPRSPSVTRRVMAPLISVGTIEENYLRYLQSMGLVADYPWSIRGFMPSEARLLAADARGHPALPGMSEVNDRRIAARLLPLDADVRFNS